MGWLLGVEGYRAIRKDRHGRLQSPFQYLKGFQENFSRLFQPQLFQDRVSDRSSRQRNLVNFFLALNSALIHSSCHLPCDSPEALKKFSAAFLSSGRAEECAGDVKWSENRAGTKARLQRKCC